MKKIFALLMVLLMCLSLAACGGKEAAVNPGSDVQQNDGGEQAPALEEILCTSEWYYVGLRTPVGLVFNADGTISGGTWTLNGTTLDCVWKNGTTSRFEIRKIKGTHFMTDEEGITLYHYGTNPDWDVFGRMPFQAWEDHLEVACVNGEYRLQLKKQYMQALLDDGSYVDICYSQGDHQQVQVRLNFDPDSYYVKIEDPAVVPLEIAGCSGVIYVLTDLM